MNRCIVIFAKIMSIISDDLQCLCWVNILVLRHYMLQWITIYNGWRCLNLRLQRMFESCYMPWKWYSAFFSAWRSVDFLYAFLGGIVKLSKSYHSLVDANAYNQLANRARLRYRWYYPYLVTSVAFTKIEQCWSITALVFTEGAMSFVFQSISLQLPNIEQIKRRFRRNGIRQ